MDNHHIFNLIENSPNFPSIPTELSEIISVLQNPMSADIDEIVYKISSIDNLETLIINYINSEYFKVKKKVTNIREAIIYLGMSTMQVIIIAVISGYLFPFKKAYSSIYNKTKYLRHTIGTAVASCAIAESVGTYDKYELFAYGLLHDIGVAVIDSCCPELMQEIIAIMKRGNHHIVAERIVLGGITHQEIGAWISGKLNFPPNIADVIINHHRPLKSVSTSSVIHIVHLGDLLSTVYYEALINEGLNPVANQSFINMFNISEERILEIRESLPKEVDKVMALFKEVL